MKRLALMAVWTIEYVVNARFVLSLSRPWRRLLWALAVLALLINWIYILRYRREDDFASSWLAVSLGLPIMAEASELVYA